MAEILTAMPGEAVTPPDVNGETKWFTTANDTLTNRLPELMKGVGYARPGGNTPLTDEKELLSRAFDANKSLRASVRKSHTDPQSVVAGINPAFSSQFGAFTAAMGMPGQNPMAQMAKQVGDILTEHLGKNITLNSPLASSALGSAGFVPYDLVSPSRLIYPVYSPLRNKIPRVPGQGTSRQAKVITGISGSNTSGGSGGGTGQFIDISRTDSDPSSGWPATNNLPPSGAQSATQINVPYKFFGLSESLSWLAQFSGQGFEDISALANLILLQEFMLNEEAAMIAGTTTAVTAPTTAVTVALRAAGSNETALPTSAHSWFSVTAANYYGETVMSTVSADLPVTSGQVVDITLPQNLPAGAMWWNIYVNNVAATTPVQSAMWRAATGIGGRRYTLQGPTVPSAGINPPAVPGPTNGTNRITGIIPTLTGQDTGAGYPTGVGYQAGYYNPNVGTHLTYNSVYNMLNGLWNGDPKFGTGFGAYKADPSELIGNSTDIMNLSNDVLAVGAATNYRLSVEQGDTAGVRIGAAVSEFQNPVTRSILRLLVHPWWPQGTVVGMSYNLPFAWSNISNIWEMTMVQDYLSISWPVIDPTFRYSMFMYGALVCNAPQYCGIMQGLQASDTTPFS